MPMVLGGAVRRTVVALAALAVTGVAVSCEPDPVRSTLDRAIDPVVVTGAQVSALNGAAPNRIVAFKGSSTGWTQIPVQVDERKATTVQAAYNLPAGQFGASTNIPVTVYADPGTFVGADTNANLDADDEIAFMARDAGGDAASLSAPAGTTGGGVELRIADPLDSAATGYVYLFRSDGSLDPSAGQHYVGYAFNLLSGDYRTTYKRAAGPNPENSTITGSTYTARFSDRWLLDSLTLTLGSKPGVDLIDRTKYRFPGTCGRSEDTFDAGEGAFLVNKVGPVRGLRSYVGANSGPNTQATHAFYDMAIDTTIDLRVHAIPGIASSFDLSRDAFGMTFRSPQATGGLAIDGVPETLAAGTPSWSTITGPQGGLGISTSFDTSLTGLTPRSTYEDDETPAATPCTGDGQAIGDSGAMFSQAIACTDPGTSCTDHLRSRTRIAATPAALSPAGVQEVAQQGLAPLTVTVSAFP
jgi:hypothetical protein